MTQNNEALEEFAQLKPLHRVLVSDKVIEYIKNLILDGKLRPGDPLPSEINMASQMNVGRSTIREALKVLIHLGLIERDNKRTLVSNDVKVKLFPHDIFEIFKEKRNIMEMIEVRRMVEPDTAALAASRAEARDIAVIRGNVEEMFATQAHVEPFIIHDHRFHLQLAEASNNGILINIMKGIQDNLVETQGHILRNSKTILPRSLEFHWKILEAIEKRSPKLARKRMLEHLMDIENEMYKILNESS